MNSKSFHSFTGTHGVDDGQIIRNFEFEIPYDFQGIKSKQELEAKILGKNGKPKGTYGPMVIFIRNLEEYLKTTYNNKVDPIKYLIYLYHYDTGDGSLSSIEIYERYGHLGNYQNDNVFTKMFKNTFGWEMKDCSYMSERTRKRIGEKSGKKKGGLLKAQKNKNLMKAKSDLKKYQKKIKSIDKSEYQILKNQTRRAIYLLTQYGYVSSEEDFNHMIIDLQKKYGCSVTSIEVQNILHQICSDNQIKQTNFEKNRVLEVVKSQKETA